MRPGEYSPTLFFFLTFSRNRETRRSKRYRREFSGERRRRRIINDEAPQAEQSLFDLSTLFVLPTRAICFVDPHRGCVLRVAQCDCTFACRRHGLYGSKGSGVASRCDKFRKPQYRSKFTQRRMPHKDRAVRGKGPYATRSPEKIRFFPSAPDRLYRLARRESPLEDRERLI